MKFEFMHPADQLVMFMERIYKNGLTTTSGGNLSIMDDNGDIWITPSGIDKGSLTRQDIMQVKPDGTVIGIHKPSVELPFHRHIYQIRPDIKAVVHAHPPACVAFSLVRRVPDVNLVPNAAIVVGEVGVAGYEIPGSKALGDLIAKEFEKGHNTVMMWNHGVVCGDKDIFNAFMKFETLEHCAKLQIDAARIGTPRVLTQQQIDLSASRVLPILDTFDSRVHSSEERAARREMCKLIHRSYAQRLIASTQGTFSTRLSDGSFIITPYQQDRAYLEPEDLVLIKNGRCEEGKQPSRSVLLHKTIYEMHPEVNSIIIAYPQYIMSYAVTDVPFDSRTIPESYIALRKAKKLPFGSSYTDILGTAKTFSNSCPMIIIENDSVILTGINLINAFDRLEVAEFTARSLICCAQVGEPAVITDEEVKEIEKAFNLTD